MLKLQYLVHLIRKTDSLEKTLMLGMVEGRRRRERQESEMVGWHHQLNGRESEQTAGDSEGQGSLACCRPLGLKFSFLLHTSNNGNSDRLYFGGVPKSLQMVTAAMKLKDAYFLEEKL